MRSRRTASPRCSAPPVTAPANYLYALTQKGVVRAEAALGRSGYVGPAPVPLRAYIAQVRTQSVGDVPLTRQHVEHALAPPRPAAARGCPHRPRGVFPQVDPHPRPIRQRQDDGRPRHRRRRWRLHAHPVRHRDGRPDRPPLRPFKARTDRGRSRRSGRRCAAPPA